jgi:hypothetical protein
MFGKIVRMNPLQSQKKLLLAESELNRAVLFGDVDALRANLRAVADRARFFGGIAASAGALISGIVDFRRGKTAAGAKSTWLQTILKGAGLISTFWRAFHPPGGNRDGS